ncbi:ABC transporter ATP-binding protein [Candidatus Bathyarchaeota archaeon]|nr:ABC transporter ATP-binding protein [Candidatus Bathyarchaeota archaeon]
MVKSLSSVAIAFANITKEYGQLRALDDVSFEVEKGEIFGFIGPNGAGKTTTIRILTTLLTPSSGEAKVLGYDLRKDSDEIRRRIGYVQQQPSTEFFMTVNENLDTYGRLWGVEKEERRKRAEFLAEKFGLNEILNKGAVELSIGERRRLQVAREFMHDMKLLFLDEPSTGLDPIVKRTLLDFIKERAKSDGVTVFFTTHIMSEAEYLCDRIAIIDKGKIIACGSVEELRRKFHSETVLVLTVEGKDEKVIRLLESVREVDAVLDDDTSIRIFTNDPYSQTPRILNILLKEGYHVTEMRVREPTLEDVFVQAIKKGGLK